MKAREQRTLRLVLDDQAVELVDALKRKGLEMGLVLDDETVVAAALACLGDQFGMIKENQLTETPVLTDAAKRAITH